MEAARTYTHTRFLPRQEFGRGEGLAKKGGAGGMRLRGTVNQIFEWHRRVSVQKGQEWVRERDSLERQLGIRGSGIYERRYPGHKTSVATGHAGTLLAREYTHTSLASAWQFRLLPRRVTWRACLWTELSIGRVPPDRLTFLVLLDLA